MTRWQDVAAALRNGITSGHYPAGSVIPRETELAEQHQVSRITIRRAVAQLTAEGLLQPIRRRGTMVRDHPPRTRITRTRTVYRDEIGYYFDPTAQPWRALTTPTIGWAPCPHDIAHILGIPPGTDVLTRDRIMGEPDTAIARQLATSYLPAHIAQGTQLAQPDTGSGGIYDRLEEMGHAPLIWTESITARMPTPTETDHLDLPPGTPLLRILRTTTSGTTGIPLEVNDTRVDAERFEISYHLTRHQTAQPPSHRQ